MAARGRAGTLVALARAHGVAKAQPHGGVEVAQHIRVGRGRRAALVELVQRLGRRAARVGARLEQPSLFQDGRDELCAKEARVVRLPRPEQRARHARVGEWLAHALRLGKAQHARHGHLGAAQALVDVVRAAPGALDQLDTHLVHKIGLVCAQQLRFEGGCVPCR